MSYERAKKALVSAVAGTGLLASMEPIVPVGTIQTLTDAGVAVGLSTVTIAIVALGLDYALSHRATSVSRLGAVPESEFEAIHQLAIGFFGNKVTTVPLMGRWHERNPRILEGIYQETRRGTRRIIDLTGYSCVIPLSRSALEDLRADRKGINEIAPEQICTSGQVPAAIYVGAVAAKGKASQSVALQATLATVKRMARNKKDRIIIARPVTPEGLHLVQSFGMRPLHYHGYEPMGVLHMARLGDIVPPGRARRLANRTNAGK